MQTTANGPEGAKESGTGEPRQGRQDATVAASALPQRNEPRCKPMDGPWKPDVVQVTSPVLRGAGDSNVSRLPATWGWCRARNCRQVLPRRCRSGAGGRPCRWRMVDTVVVGKRITGPETCDEDTQHCSVYRGHLAPEYRRHPPRSSLTHAERDNPDGVQQQCWSANGNGGQTSQQAQDRTKKRRPAAERKRESITGRIG